MTVQVNMGRMMMVAVGVTIWLLAGSARSQGDDSNATDPGEVRSTVDDRDPTDTVVVSPEDTVDDRDGRILSSDQVKELVEPATDVPSDFRPPRPEYRRIPQELELKLREFQRLRERYLREQERLIKLYKGATEPERDLIRQRLQLRREEWLERSLSIKENSRERLRDLMRELPKHREALDAARDAARDQLQDVRRRGIDD